MQKLIEINTSASLASGLFIDVPKNQEAIWRDGVNVIFKDSGVEKRKGYSVLFSGVTWDFVEHPGITATYIRDLVQTYSPGTSPTLDGPTQIIYIKYGNNLGPAYSFQIAQYSRQDNASGGIVTAFSQIDDHTPVDTVDMRVNWAAAMLAWGVDLVWGSGDPDITWTIKFFDRAAGTTTKTIIPSFPDESPFVLDLHKNHIFAYVDDTARWASADSYTDWTATSSNSAGDMTLRGIDNKIIAVATIDQSKLICTKGQAWLQAYVGAPFYFGFSDTPLSGIGAIGPYALCSVSAKQLCYGLGPLGFWVSDGRTYSYIDGPQVNRWFLENFDPTTWYDVFAYHHDRDASVEWLFTCLDGQRRSLTFNYGNGTWTKSETDVLVAKDTKVYDKPIGAVGSSILLLDTGYDLGANPMSTSLTTFPMFAQDRERFKQWDMLRINRDKDVVIGNLEFRLGYHDEAEADLDTEVDWTSWATLDYENWLDSRQSVYLTLELRSTALGDYWRIGGFSIHGQVCGYL